MTRRKIFAAAAAALTLGVFACDRNDNRASETNTTSAQAVPVPADPVAPAPVSATADTETGLEAKDGGHLEGTSASTGGGSFAKDGGHVTSDTSSGTSTSTSTSSSPSPALGAKAKDAGATRNAATPAGGDREVAPGHIMVPPERGPGTGQPNSNGSHNIGSR